LCGRLNWEIPGIGRKEGGNGLALCGRIPSDFSRRRLARGASTSGECARHRRGSAEHESLGCIPERDRDQQVCTWFNRRLRRSALENGLQLHTILFPSNRESRRSPAVVACDAQGRLVFGEEAMREARLHPSRAVREPLRLLGQVSSSRAVSHLGVPTSARKRHERERLHSMTGSGVATGLSAHEARCDARAARGRAERSA
jgi:S1-C subfamily serine protease